MTVQIDGRTEQIARESHKPEHHDDLEETVRAAIEVYSSLENAEEMRTEV